MDASNSAKQDTSPKFCDECGRSLVALSVPHVSRACVDCGKTTHFADPDENGKGIKVEKGDTFSIPANWLTLSLDPSKSRGRFSRHGLNWFVEHIMASILPTNPAEVKEFLDRIDKQVDDALLNSTLMPGIDPNSQEDMGRAFERFKDSRDTIEWRSLTLAAFRFKILQKLEDDEAGKEEVAFLMAHAMIHYALLVYKRDLESHVWTGYEQTQMVYEVVTATASTPTEARALEALRPAFERLSEEVLTAWVESGTDISEKLGVTALDAKIVNALAKFHLAEFERKRQNEAMLREARGKKWGAIATAASAGAAVATVIIALLAYLGVFNSSHASSGTRPAPSASSSASSSPSASASRKHS